MHKTSWCCFISQLQSRIISKEKRRLDQKTFMVAWQDSLLQYCPHHFIKNNKHSLVRLVNHHIFLEKFLKPGSNACCIITNVFWTSVYFVCLQCKHVYACVCGHTYMYVGYIILRKDGRKKKKSFFLEIRFLHLSFSHSSHILYCLYPVTFMLVVKKGFKRLHLTST